MNDGTDLVAGVVSMSAIGAVAFHDLGFFPFLLLFVVVGTTALFFGYRAVKRPKSSAIENTTLTTPTEISGEKQNNE